MIKPSCGEAWTVKFFPAVYLITQKVPKVRAVTDSTRPSASFQSFQHSVLPQSDLDSLPMPTIATGSCWSHWIAAMANSNSLDLQNYQTFKSGVECHLDVKAYDSFNDFVDKLHLHYKLVVNKLSESFVQCHHTTTPRSHHICICISNWSDFSAAIQALLKANLIGRHTTVCPMSAQLKP